MLTKTTTTPPTIPKTIAWHPSLESPCEKPTPLRLPTAKSRRPRPWLRFTPYSWSKLLFLRDAGPTEVGAFGISSPGDLLLVEDLVLVHQDCTEVTVRFDDGSVADHFDRQVDLGRTPEQVGRIWIHTHPGSCPLPSRTDEATFSRCFGSADWAVLFILARGGKSYARIRFTAGPGGELELPVGLACEVPFPAADTAAWKREYEECVHSDAMCWDGWELRPHALDDEAFLSAQLADRTVEGEQYLQSFWPEEVDHAWIV